MNQRQDQWDASYQRHENFVFAPCEQLVRFISRYVRKRTGLDQFVDVLKLGRTIRMLDLGCGIGRHVIFAHEMGLEAFGVDLSPLAVESAKKWASSRGMKNVERSIHVGSVTELPFENRFFDVIVSHGVLDSMPFDVAQSAVKECSRVLEPQGLFYCDLISPEDSKHGREFDGEEVVATQHERDTIQSYFNFAKIQRLVAGHFEIVEGILARQENLLRHEITARTHLVLRNVL